MAKIGSTLNAVRDERIRAMLAPADRYGDLDRIIEEVLFRRLEDAAVALRAAGFSVLTETRGITFRCACVYPPDGNGPGEWATPAEMRRLLDTVHNLPPAEAFHRWAAKIEPLETEEYTRADAVRDTREARQRLRADLDAGRVDKITVEDWQAASFMDLAPPLR